MVCARIEQNLITRLEAVVAAKSKGWKRVDALRAALEKGIEPLERELELERKTRK